MTTQLDHHVDDARAWRRDQIETSSPWLMTLPTVCRDIIADCAAPTDAITDVQLDDAARAAGREALAAAVHQLEHGCGFVVLDRLPINDLTVPQATLAYWLVGQMFGDPFEQNVRGTLLYDVRDSGGDYTQGARFSTTSARSSFHTDGAFNPRIADYVSLLCVRTAVSGGENEMLSAYTLHNVLRQTAPQMLDTLYRPMHFDRRGEHHPGESPTTATPIFGYDGRELTMRYLNYYIHEGHRIAGAPLTGEQTHALDAVENLLDDPSLSVQFSLEPGQILIANNHWTLHNRNAFVDHEDPALRRHYVRLWTSR